MTCIGGASSGMQPKGKRRSSDAQPPRRRLRATWGDIVGCIPRDSTQIGSELTFGYFGISAVPYAHICVLLLQPSNATIPVETRLARALGATSHCRPRTSCPVDTSRKSLSYAFNAIVVSTVNRHSPVSVVRLKTDKLTPAHTTSAS